MAIIPRRPFWDINKWFEDGEDWPEFLGPRLRMRGLEALRAPKIDIYETEKDIVADIELPGVDPKDIDVEVRDNVLKIEAKKKEKKEEKGKGYYHKEISSGYYKRAMPLPVEVQGNKTNAVYQDGMLKIIIPKKEIKKPEEEKGVKVKVKSA